MTLCLNFTDHGFSISAMLTANVLNNFSSPLPQICTLAEYGTIAHSLQSVESLRTSRRANHDLRERTSDLRRWQADRFRQTYSDFFSDQHLRKAAQFFLSQLYGTQEHNKRDAQFARIAGTLERIFPESIVKVATLLAQLHALSETLDACMAYAWIELEPDFNKLNFGSIQCDRRYRAIWRILLTHTGFHRARLEQLSAVQELGLALQRHTRVPSLRLMLKMMRHPASAAGLHDLQRFLETGFDIFDDLVRSGKASLFLQLIATREAQWISDLSD